jgi:hypothetical protein
MTKDNTILNESDSSSADSKFPWEVESNVAPLKHRVPRVCLACHAEMLGIPVTPRDCLGFAKCETCTKVPIDGDESEGSQPMDSA